MDDGAPSSMVQEHVYLLDIIGPLGLPEWIALSFSLFLILIGGRLIAYHSFTIAILTGVEDTLPAPTDRATAFEPIDPLQQTELDIEMQSDASEVDESECLLRTIDQEVDEDYWSPPIRRISPIVRASRLMQALRKRFTSARKNIKIVWQALSGTGRITDELWGAQKWIFQERGLLLACPAIGQYVGWTCTYFPFKIVLNSIVNGIVFGVHFLGQTLSDPKWERPQEEFSNFPASYEPFFVPLTALCGIFVTLLCAGHIIWMIQCIVYFDPPRRPLRRVRGIKDYIRQSFPDRPTLLAITLYAVASELTLNLPVLAVRNSRLPPNGPWEDTMDRHMIHAILLEWVAYFLLYLFLEVPAMVYLSRVAASRINDGGDSVVEFQHVKNLHSYSEAMRGFGWKGWLRVAKMYLKMIMVLFLFFTMNGIILSMELQLFGVFDEFKLWFVARYLYFEGGVWEALSYTLFWFRVAIKWT